MTYTTLAKALNKLDLSEKSPQTYLAGQAKHFQKKACTNLKIILTLMLNWLNTDASVLFRQQPIGASKIHKMTMDHP
jgi:hypothetical protein